MSKKYQCKCCGYYTLESNETESFEICPVCYWEKDNIQNDNPTYEGGANSVSLNEAKNNFKTYGAAENKFIDYVRLPYESEKH